MRSLSFNGLRPVRRERRALEDADRRRRVRQPRRRAERQRAARLAGPFADPAAGKFVKIDPDTCARGGNTDTSEVTRVALTDAEARTNALTEAEEAVRAAEPYGFICERFS